MKLDLHTFKELIDNVYDEIFIWNDSYQIVYANKACQRHYGLMPKDIIGKTLSDFHGDGENNFWTPTSIPYVYREKVPVIQKQKTLLGTDIETISIPILDSHNNVKYVIQSIRDSQENLYKNLSPIKIDSDENIIIDNDFIYKSSQMKEVISYSQKISVTDMPILILGETGTGKSMLGKYIHSISNRSCEPFIHVNVASINPSIIESEFFGYKKGSFTGADNKDKKGFFESAGKGTIFLDEIGELNYDLQSKFLHIIQEKQFFPVGSTSPVEFNARIICATNTHLKKLIEIGRFREDLYHRLNTFEIIIPPLRERKQDIKLLACHFLDIFNKKYNKYNVFSDDFTEQLIGYPWTGNIRELSNIIERSVLIATNNLIEISDFPDSFFSINSLKYQKKNNECSKSLDELVEDYEKTIVKNAYTKFKTSRKVAQALNISQSKANRLRLKYLQD